MNGLGRELALADHNDDPMVTRVDAHCNAGLRAFEEAPVELYVGPRRLSTYEAKPRNLRLDRAHLLFSERKPILPLPFSGKLTRLLVGRERSRKLLQLLVALPEIEQRSRGRIERLRLGELRATFFDFALLQHELTPLLKELVSLRRRLRARLRLRVRSRREQRPKKEHADAYRERERAHARAGWVRRSGSRRQTHDAHVTSNSRFSSSFHSLLPGPDSWYPSPVLLTDDALERNAIVGGKFRVIGKLGGGGMGVVYEGEHIDLKQKVAIKVIISENQSEDMVKRFRREALVMAQLESDHVVRVMDYGALPSGAPYLVMEFLRGMDLCEYLQKYGRFLLPEVAEIGVAACDALTDAHSKGIVHRDLKPSNLFLADRAGGRRSLKVLDFGLSFFHQKSDESITKEHSVLGTPLYAAPELFSSSQDVDGRADIWALGATLYELATGQVPFPAESLPELARKLREGPPDATLLNPKIPPAMARVFEKCLSWEREDRYKSARDLRRELRVFRTHGHTSVLFGQAFPEHEGVPTDRTSIAVSGSAGNEDIENDTTLPQPSQATVRTKPRANQEPVPAPGIVRKIVIAIAIAAAVGALGAIAIAISLSKTAKPAATDLPPPPTQEATVPLVVPTLPEIATTSSALPTVKPTGARTSAQTSPKPSTPVYTARPKPVSALPTSAPTTRK